MAVDDGPWLTLPFTDKDWKVCTEQAKYVVHQYENNPKATTVFKTSIERTRMGFLAEEVLANHLGRQRVSVRTPWAGPDISPDIEVRTVKRPYKTEMWERTALSLYKKDLKKLDRRYVLAAMSDDDIRYYGWAHGKDIAFKEAVAVQRYQESGTYDLWGYAYPDELQPMHVLLDDLLPSV